MYISKTRVIFISSILEIFSRRESASEYRNLSFTLKDQISLKRNFYLKVKMLNVTVGNNARTHGVCCIAIGDDTTARGAYQVSVGERVSLPNDMTAAFAVATIQEVRELKLTFQAMVDQRVAPATFGTESTRALDILVSAFEKHLGKSFDELLVEVKKQQDAALEAQGSLLLKNENVQLGTKIIRKDNSMVEPLHEKDEKS
jgi:hypothetical protein